MAECPGCGVLLDDGNEMLAYKYVECGIFTEGNVEYFATEKEYSLEVVDFYKEKILCKHCGKELEKNLNFAQIAGNHLQLKK